MQYLCLAKRTLLRKFGNNFYAYNAKSDTLYELDDEAFYFLLKCDGRRQEIDGQTLKYLLSEGLVELSSEHRDIEFYQQEEPSLRYLLLNITLKCNLKCQHCYVKQKDVFMDFETFKKAVDDFYRLGGLKLIISGGEPLLHPEIFRFLEYSRKYPLRVVLLTNGYLINKETALKISELVDEVQISLDGLKGHKKLRGLGWEKVAENIRLLSEITDVSVSTMITKYNVDEFEKMRKLLEKTKIIRWSIDVPTTEKELIPSEIEIRKIMTDYGFGDLGHVSSPGYCCGAHYCEINADGSVKKCGFFDESVGNVREGLEVSWSRLKRNHIWKIEDLKCSCSFMDDCRGGCRYRALVYSGDLFSCDPVMCLLYGVESCP
ncbi:radical SAM/SPASM domain-containing protein [Archaeoglobus neptunius]|uniref:radical SAM/SPASM domain-containing protein n=1 Tax=Archaeoglobus neptunius TaxID=2798580 RepID=UPI00192540E9|nr:radical SAM protein [Archaeoglobus neptunius]